MIVTRSAMELLEQEDAIERRRGGGGLWERDGVIMTASALSLLQAQEAMQRADSSGQDWGRESRGPARQTVHLIISFACATADTWDGIRGQYIPKWARKLTPADQWPLVDEDGKPLKVREESTLGYDRTDQLTLISTTTAHASATGSTSTWKPSKLATCSSSAWKVSLIIHIRAGAYIGLAK